MTGPVEEWDDKTRKLNLMGDIFFVKGKNLSHTIDISHVASSNKYLNISYSFQVMALSIVDFFALL